MGNRIEDIYEIVVGKSEPTTGDCETTASIVSEELKKMQAGFAVCWLWHEVLFGKIENGVLAFPAGKTVDLDRDLREMRLFNKDRELYLYRTENGFAFRSRIDDTGKSAEYIEARQALWGTTGEVDGGWTILSEKRGIRLEVPIEANGVNEKCRVAALTRNYITYSEVGQASITDCRFVDFIFEGR
jgi:CRISPR-associated protein (TIGR03984 family)